MRQFIFFVVLLIVGCEGIHEKDVIPFTKTDKAIIYDFSDSLTTNIQNLKYDVIKSGWSDEAFKERVRVLLKADPTAFNYVYDEELKHLINEHNVSLVNLQKYEKAKFYAIRTEILENHAEITYLLVLKEYFKIWKFRIELLENTPIINDYYLFREDVWASYYMNNLARINKAYLAGSKQRTRANTAFIDFERAKYNRNPHKALEYLDSVPETHRIGNYVSLLKLNTASEINDSVFFSILEEEKRVKNSIYLDYLHAYYNYDLVQLDRTYKYMMKEIGLSGEHVDSISLNNLIWQ